MPPWELPLDLTASFTPGAVGSGSEPRYVQIARAIAADISRGRLRPGQRLPGSRSLAASIEVHRNTVVAAYAELVAEGWLTTGAGRGTFVTKSMPTARPRRFASSAVTRPQVPSQPCYQLAGVEPPLTMPRPAPTAAEPLHLGGGLPDLRLLPTELFGRAYRRAMTRSGRQLLDYGDPRGLPALRSALADMLAARRGLATGADDLLITRGSQMALALVATALLQPGDRVAVEGYGYRPAWEAMQLRGATLCPIPVDAHGLEVSALEQLLEQGPIRALYVTPHHQYPTTRVLAPGRRLQLLELARRHRFAILEDDYDNEYHYDGRPVLPLASADHAGSVVYIGSLSKVVAPGLRIGYVSAPAPLLTRLTQLRTLLDRQGDQIAEAAIAELIEDGDLQRHIWRTRRSYRARRDALLHACETQLAGTITCVRPTGGMACWASVDPAIEVDRWAERAAERGVVFATGSQFAFDGSVTPYARLGFARLSEQELDRAVAVLAQTRPRRASRS